MLFGYTSRPMIDLSRVPPAPRRVHRRASLGFFFGPARLLTIILGLSAVAMVGMVFRYALTMAYGTDVTGQILHHGIVRHKNTYTHYLDIKTLTPITSTTDFRTFPTGISGQTRSYQPIR